jgi:hypothetical protein
MGMKTAMAANPQLIKQWIKYLKNNQIAELKSDPDTGDLSYRRPVKTEDVHNFLEVETDYTPEQISNAIHTVLTGNAINKQPPKLQNNKTPSSDVSTWRQSEVTPGQKQQAIPYSGNQPVQPTKSPRRSNDDATDIEYRDVNEAIKDNPGDTLSEDDVEKIFDMLSSAPADKAANVRKGRAPKEVQPDTGLTPEEKQASVRKLKRLIRDTMTDGQRQALWRILNEV